MPWGEYTEYIGIRVSKEMRQELDALAKAKYSDVSQVVRQAIGVYVALQKNCAKHEFSFAKPVNRDRIGGQDEGEH